MSTIDRLFCRNNILNALHRVHFFMKAQIAWSSEAKGHIGSGRLSQDASGVFENQLAKILNELYPEYNIIPALNDNSKPDLNIIKSFGDTAIPVEIKFSSDTKAWQGGQFSKREGWHILVSWANNFESFFATLAFLRQDHWLHSGNENFYGTKLPLSTILELAQDDKLLLVGSIVNDKIALENIFQKPLQFV